MGFFKKIINSYRESKEDFIQTFYVKENRSPDKIISKIIIFWGNLLLWLLLEPIVKFADSCLEFLQRRKISPFIKEWILASLKYSIFGPGFFLFMLFLNCFGKLEGSWFELVLWCFIYVPLITTGIVTFLMITPRREMEDMLFFYRLRCHKKVSIASCGSFRTTIDFNYGYSPLSHMYNLDTDVGTLLALKLYCQKLGRDHVSHSSKTKYDLQAYSYADPAEESGEIESEEDLERLQIGIQNAAHTEKDLKQWKFRVKAAFPAEAIDWFIELTEKEPSMEFEVEYLFFSKLLINIRPIEGYDYPEGVPELLEKLNATVNPWIKK